MPRWRVDYLGKKGSHLGTVEAADEREAIEQAAKQFSTTPARRGTKPLAGARGKAPA